MSLINYRPTRYFAVVGAACVPERHFDGDDDDITRRTSQHLDLGVADLPPTGSSGFWLLEDR